MIIYVIAFVCVAGIASGQILFKLCAVSLLESGTFWSVKPVATLAGALSLYGLASVAWVWVLLKIDLGKVYPLMALSFILVPLGSHLVFGEKFQLQYFIGVLIIILGIFVTVKA